MKTRNEIDFVKNQIYYKYYITNEMRNDIYYSVIEDNVSEVAYNLLKRDIYDIYPITQTYNLIFNEAPENEEETKGMARKIVEFVVAFNRVLRGE